MKKLALALLLLFMCSLPAQGADNDEPTARAWGNYTAKADLDSYGGGYSQANAGLSLGWRWFTLTYITHSYSWNNVDKLPFGNASSDPWRHLNTLDLDARFNGQFTRNLGWFAGANVYSGWEQDVSDSLGAGGRLGIDYNLGGNWRLRLGAFLMYHPVGLRGFPVAGISWKENSSDLGWSFSLGSPATEVSYRFNSMLALRLGARYQYEVYRLANDSTVAEKGYLNPRAIVGGAYADITPVARLNLSVGLEGNLWRELQIYNEDGDKLQSHDVDPAMGFVFRLNYGF